MANGTKITKRENMSNEKSIETRCDISYDQQRNSMMYAKLSLA